VKRLLFSLLLATCAVTAQEGAHVSRVEGIDPAADQEDKVGAVVDRELAFTDERGYPFQLKQLFPGKQPVVLILGYSSCPSMCGVVLGAAFDALSEVELQPGADYRILSVSINPQETPEEATARKQNFLRRLLKTGGDDAWRLCLGDEATIRKLADSVGFHYYFTPATGQYSHPPSLIFLTPEGKVSRIIKNTFFDPRDVRLALVEASDGKIGTFWDQVQLNCLTYDPRTKSYNLAAMTIMRVAGGLTVAALAWMIWVMLRRERRKTTTAVA
jgi:protein SCO1/2